MFENLGLIITLLHVICLICSRWTDYFANHPLHKSSSWPVPEGNRTTRRQTNSRSVKSQTG